MPRKIAVLGSLLIVAALASSAEASAAAEVRLLFTGDILFSRQVQAEWQRRDASPWADLSDLFHSADWVGGNLEGALGAADACIPSTSPCFATPDAIVPLLKKAGFSAVIHENNHAGDLGEIGRLRTLAQFQNASLLALDFEHSPQFVRVGDTTVALIAISVVAAADGRVQTIPSVALSQKLRLARQLAGIVAVSIHWGTELIDWPSGAQRQQAAWLVDHGADLILGHHPHVVQSAECVHDKPVFFSLGNHVFDQKYPETKHGEIADCRIRDGQLRCAAIRTQTEPATTYPTRVGDDGASPDQMLAQCIPPVRPELRFGDTTIRPQPWSADQPPDSLALEGWRDNKLVWRSRRQRILSLENTSLAGADQPALLFALEQHASPLDMATDVRPYVYAIGPRGLVAKWRGSALAWPLIDARFVADGQTNLLCALHRGDSFVALDPATHATRIAAYRWNGFGFSGVDTESAAVTCKNVFM